MATLVAIRERGRGLQTGSASPRGSSRSSRHCRAAPAHHAATQWFLLTFHFRPLCAFRTPFSLCAPSLFSSALGSTQRSRVQKQYLRNAELSLSLSSGASPCILTCFFFFFFFLNFPCSSSSGSLPPYNSGNKCGFLLASLNSQVLPHLLLDFYARKEAPQQ